MDWNSIITAMIGAFTAAGGVTGFFQIKEAKRAKKIENDKAAAGEWKELYEKSEAKCETLSQKLDSIYVLFRQEQERRQELAISLERAQILRCDKLKCTDREPPLGDIKPENK